MTEVLFFRLTEAVIAIEDYLVAQTTVGPRRDRFIERAYEGMRDAVNALRAATTR